MAYNEHLAERITKYLEDKKLDFRLLKMMGGLCYMVNEKMCCGLLFDKNKEIDLLMARIGEEAYDREISKPECYPMDFTGRPMRGYIFVGPEGMDIEEDLEYWLQLCLDFNPLAKSSKKKR
jgi:hypothetical protein